MPLGPVAHDGREFSHLETEAPVFPRRDAERVLIERHARVGVAGIIAAVGARLREKVDVRAELRVEEKGEPRIEKGVPFREEQAGGRLRKDVAFEVGEAAETGADVAVKGVHGERGVEAVEPVVRLRSGLGTSEEGGGEKTGDRFHTGCMAVAMASRSAGMRTGLLMSTSTSGNSSFS